MLRKALPLLVFLCVSKTVKADYTIASGSTIYANTITAQSGILTINGTLFLDRNVSLLNFTSVVINGPNGQIYWDGNYDLKFSSGIDFDINNPTLGLQPTAGNGNASTKLIIGSTTIAVSSDNSQAAAYSFEQFNSAGGLPKFTYSASTSNVCFGTTFTVTLAPFDNITQFDCLWSVNNGGSISPLSNLNFTTAQTATITPANIDGTHTITCRVYRAGDNDIITTRTVTVTINAAGVWVGSSNQDWNNTANWCSAALPTSSTNVVINNGSSFYPLITGTALANNITVATGGAPAASVTVSTGGTFKIAGAITSTSGINASAGTIELTGAAPQTISGNNFVFNTIAYLTSNNPSATGVTINSTGGMLNVSGVVSFGNINNATITSNGNLTLLSSALATASLADVTNNAINSGNKITGTVVVERYIPGNRFWRLLSAPVTKASNVTIKSAWQEGALSSISDPNPGYGTHITYGNPATNGYDQGINGNTSIKYLTSTGWNGIPTATNNNLLLNAGNVADQPGYFVFVRGNRSTVLSSGTAAAVSPTILRVKGNLNIGQLDIALGTTYNVGSSHWRVVSNPYPSTINFNKIVSKLANTSAGFANAFYLWDPNVGGTYGKGGWVGFTNYSSGAYTKSVTGSLINNVGDIQSGTAFLIDHEGASTITINEADKVSGSDNKQFRPSKAQQQLRSNLFIKQPNDSIILLDGAVQLFDEKANNIVDRNDLKKLDNFDENIAILVAENRLSIESRHVPAEVDTITFHLSKLKQNNYQLEVDMTNMETAKNSLYKLEDAFTSTKTALLPQAKNIYPFTVNTDNASANSKRLRIVIGPKFRYNAFDAVKLNGQLQLKWIVSADDFVPCYDVEKSDDGVSFVQLINRTSDKKEGINSYELMIGASTLFDKYYRIKTVTLDGAIVYSESRKIPGTAASETISIFPNPVNGNTINLNFYKMPAGKYAVNITNNLGATISLKQIQHPGGTAVKSILLKQSLAAGQYHIEINNRNNVRKLIKVIAVSK